MARPPAPCPAPAARAPASPCRSGTGHDHNGALRALFPERRLTALHTRPPAAGVAAPDPASKGPGGP